MTFENGRSSAAFAVSGLVQVEKATVLTTHFSADALTGRILVGILVVVYCLLAYGLIYIIGFYNAVDRPLDSYIRFEVSCRQSDRGIGMCRDPPRPAAGK